MSSIREQLLEAMVTAWNTDRPDDVPELVRAPSIQAKPNPVSAELYWLTDEEKPSSRDDDDTSPVQVHELVAAIEIRAKRSADVAKPETALDPCAVWAVATLNDNQLGHLAQFMRVRGSEIHRANREQPYALLLIGVLIKYCTDATDFTAAIA